MTYQVSKMGKPIGLFGRRQIFDGVASGMLSQSDHVWREGMSSWATIGALGLGTQGPDVTGFWDSMRAGAPPVTCPHCGSGKPISLQALYRGPTLVPSVQGVVISQSNLWDAPPPIPSTMGLGFMLYLLAWPFLNMLCLVFAHSLGESWLGLGILLSFGCLAGLIIWHRKKIAQNNFNHAKRSYIWRNTYRCTDCGALSYSLDPDAEGELTMNDLQPG